MKNEKMAQRGLQFMYTFFIGVWKMSYMTTYEYVDLNLLLFTFSKKDLVVLKKM